MGTCVQGLEHLYTLAKEFNRGKEDPQAKENKSRKSSIVSNKSKHNTFHQTYWESLLQDRR